MPPSSVTALPDHVPESVSSCRTLNVSSLAPERIQTWCRLKTRRYWPNENSAMMGRPRLSWKSSQPPPLPSSSMLGAQSVGSQTRVDDDGSGGGWLDFHD